MLPECVLYVPLHGTVVEKSYTGPRLGGVDERDVTLDFIKSMMQDFKEQKNIHKRFRPLNFPSVFPQL
jgi:hypothetical protein